jgi:hypothetical protein
VLKRRGVPIHRDHVREVLSLKRPEDRPLRFEVGHGGKRLCTQVVFTINHITFALVRV